MSILKYDKQCSVMTQLLTDDHNLEDKSYVAEHGRLKLTVELK